MTVFAKRFCLVCFAVLGGSLRADEVLYLPGWMRTAQPDPLAWQALTNAFPDASCRFWPWEGNASWSRSRENADAEVARLSAHLAALAESRRARVVLVGHSLGARIVARTLARLSADGMQVKQGILLAPALPATDPAIARMGGGSRRQVLTLVNPDDVTLKYVYGLAGGESAATYGSAGAPGESRNVAEIPVAKEIAEKTSVPAFWGKVAAMKAMANHHACFYLEALRGVLAGQATPSRVLVFQDKVNLPLKVMGAQIWWRTLDAFGGWRLERHILTRHCRLLDPRRVRQAWGNEGDLRAAFAKIKQTISLEDGRVRPTQRREAAE